MTHALPTATGNITHAKIDRVEDFETQIRVYVYYGEMVDGTFERHFLSDEAGAVAVRITNVDEFDASSTAVESAPENKGDPRGGLKTDLLDYIDTNSKWHNQ